MGAEQVSQQFKRALRRVGDSFRSALIDDLPPGVRMQRGEATPTVSAIRAMNERVTLSSLLPYESYDPETGLYYNVDNVGFVIGSAPATGISPSDIPVLNGIFNQAHKSNATLQVTLMADTGIENYLDYWGSIKNQAAAEEQEIFDVMIRNRIDYFKRGKWESLLSDQASMIRNFRFLLSYTIPVPAGASTHELPQEDIDRLTRLRDAFIGTLRSVRMQGYSVEPEEFINLMAGLLNPGRKPAEHLQWDEHNPLHRQMVSADTMAVFGPGSSSLVHEGEPFSLLSYHVRQFPQKWAAWRNGELIGSFTNNILRLPCPFVLTLTVNAPDQISARSLVQRKSLRATQMADSPLAKYATQWADRKVDWDFTKEKVDNGNRFMEAFFQILLITPQGREQECESALKSCYDAIGWVLGKSRYIPQHAFLGALPMGVSEETKRALKIFGHYHSRLSWTCTNIAPWIGEWTGTPTPTMLFTGRRGQLTYFNNFDNTKGNFNIAMMAASGGGKSFLTQEMVFCTIAAGGVSFVIDSGHSYKNLCALLRGTYLEFGDPSRVICLNPFSSINSEDPRYFKEQLPLLKMLVAQMASSDRPLSAKQKAVLEKAILGAWEKYGNQATITRVCECLQNDNSDDGPMHATGKDLAVMLHSYTRHGMYGDYFEGEANIDLTNRFVVLELDALNSMPDLQAVVLLILMMRITQVMYLSGNKSQRKLCIIDEAWRLMGRGSAGDFIAEGYRVARKHGGAFVTITQKVSDYFSSETAKAAYMNSDYSIFLRQKLAELSIAENAGYLDNSDGTVDVLRTLDTQQGKYSEIAINSPDGLSVVRFQVDQATEKIYSTKAEEVDFLKEQKARGVPFFEAINALVQRSAKR